MFERRIGMHLPCDLFFFFMLLKLLRLTADTIPVAFMAGPQGRTTPKVLMVSP